MQQPQPTLLITRPEPAGPAFALSVIEALGRPVPTILSAVMEIEPVDVTLGQVPAGLILTSVNGAEAARRIGLPRGLPAWCVGDRTAQAARNAGFEAVSAKGDSTDLIARISAAQPKGPLLHLHGAYKTGDIVNTLGKAGVACFSHIGYRQIPRDLTDHAKTALSGDKSLVLPMFSPRTVALLADQGPFRAPLTVIAISPAVADAAARLHPHRLIQAQMPNAAAMCHTTCEAIDAISLPPGP